MLRLAADENLNNDIIRGLLRRKPDLDIVRIQDAHLSGETDPIILQWCADNGRVLLTNDVSTITKHGYERVALGKSMPGVFEVGRDLPVGAVIEDILCLQNVALTKNGKDRFATCLFDSAFPYHPISGIQFNGKNNSSTAIFLDINP